MDVTSFILDDNSDQDFAEGEGTHQNHVVSGDVTTDSDDDVSIESGCVSWDSDYSNGRGETECLEREIKGETFSDNDRAV